jgi:hypothetical protein
MPTANIYDLYITDADRNILLEEKSIAADAAENIIREYPWQSGQKSYIQLWKPHKRFSFSVHYLPPIKKYSVGFSDKVSLFKLPLPYIGVSYGNLDDMGAVIAALHLFLEGEFEKLQDLLAKYRPEQKGD